MVCYCCCQLFNFFFFVIFVLSLRSDVLLGCLWIQIHFCCLIGIMFAGDVCLSRLLLVHSIYIAAILSFCGFLCLILSLFVFNSYFIFFMLCDWWLVVDSGWCHLLLCVCVWECKVCWFVYSFAAGTIIICIGGLFVCLFLSFVLLGMSLSLCVCVCSFLEWMSVCTIYNMFNF